MGRWLFAVLMPLLAGALAGAPLLLLSLWIRPLGAAAALPVFCAVSVLAAPYAARQNKEAATRRLAGALSAALALAASSRLPAGWAVAAAFASLAATALAFPRRFRSPAQFVELRKPPTKKGL